MAEVCHITHIALVVGMGATNYKVLVEFVFKTYGCHRSLKYLLIYNGTNGNWQFAVLQPIFGNLTDICISNENPL